jgi:hypothetical protein
MQKVKATFSERFGLDRKEGHGDKRN